MKPFILLILFFFPLVSCALESYYLEPRLLKRIDKTQVNVIVEVGSFKGEEAFFLHQFYKKPVYAFECDIRYFHHLVENVKLYPNIFCFNYRPWHETRYMSFYTSDCSSSYYEPERWSRRFYVEDFCNEERNPCDVQAVRLDEWMKWMNLKQIDLLCLDGQGAALHVLEGLGSMLSTVHYIILREDPYTPFFSKEVRSYLKKKGFKCIHERSALFYYELFINKH